MGGEKIGTVGGRKEGRKKGKMVGCEEEVKHGGSNDGWRNGEHVSGKYFDARQGARQLAEHSKIRFNAFYLYCVAIPFSTSPLLAHQSEPM